MSNTYQHVCERVYQNKFFLLTKTRHRHTQSSTAFHRELLRMGGGGKGRNVIDNVRCVVGVLCDRKWWVGSARFVFTQLPPCYRNSWRVLLIFMSWYMPTISLNLSFPSHYFSSSPSSSSQTSFVFLWVHSCEPCTLLAVALFAGRKYRFSRENFQ